MGIQDYVDRGDAKFFVDHGRVIAKFFSPGIADIRIPKIIHRALAIPPERIPGMIEQISREFSGRHINLLGVFDKHFQKVSKYIPDNIDITDDMRSLIGAYFTHEYSIQAAAFFNPSIVPHPDQSHLSAGSLRFILSFRSTGEGHISSIEFRSGIIKKSGKIVFDPVSRYVYTPDLIENPVYDKKTFKWKLLELIPENSVFKAIFKSLPPKFSFDELNDMIASYKVEEEEQQLFNETVENILWLAESNYQVKFDTDRRISERVLFPVSDMESKGLEDARFVLFTDDVGEKTYYATYTAYNGHKILPMMMETKDFIDFNITTLNGSAIKDKGMALFPRKVDGKYMMISRQDGENMYIVTSDNLHFWNEAELLYTPQEAWEFVQTGNCGSPVEIDEGWILVTHGVGPMRKYCLGALLLDKEDPSKVLMRLPEPLITPLESEREGYVPNVVYTCGAIIHNKDLVIPYAMSDTISGVATVPVDKLLEHMVHCE